MKTWIALLRGVNVNGITVRSAELAQLFRDLGFSKVRTVFASGNVVFDTSETNQATLKTHIEAGLSDRFGYEAWIVLVAHDTLERIIDEYPFAQDAEHHAYVIFASTDGARDELLTEAPGDEEVAGGNGVVYWRCAKGQTVDTAFAKHLAKARFKATTTNRNINTLRKLL